MERASTAMANKLPAVGAGTCCLWHWLLCSDAHAGTYWMWTHLSSPLHTTGRPIVK